MIMFDSGMKVQCQLRGRLLLYAYTKAVFLEYEFWITLSPSGIRFSFLGGLVLLFTYLGI